ncbi:Uncharacterised protein [Salmonella enterica subsp. enterica]|uniref:Uncharacterized protein n=1 Tax=Salmonella enterica I TaxID=59201 RepID=A0A379X142_SALET|nr:Uncharacterised protein [Salmonella enterica subsp. enterica]
MVGADLPQGVFTLHTLVTDHGIHDGLLESMSHMQTAGDVRRRDHDAEGLFAFVAVRLEIALLFPVLVKRLFDILGVICLFHYFQVAVFRLKTSHAVGFVAFARQLFQSFFVRDEVYHFCESGGKICKACTQAD